MKSVAEEQGLDTETVIVEPAEVVKNDIFNLPNCSITAKLRQHI